MRHWFAIAAVGLVVVAFFWGVLTGQADFPRGDLTDRAFPARQLLHEEIREGRLPLWTHYAQAGYPFLADPRSAALYPPAVIVALLFRPEGQLPFRAVALEAVAHLLLASIFAYLLAWRLIGRTLPAIATALVFALGGGLTSLPVRDFAAFEAGVWLPLTLLFLLGATRPGPPGRASAALAGLTLALAALAGGGPALVWNGVVGALFFGFAVWQAGQVAPFGQLGRLLLAGAVALGIAAAQLLPAVELAQQLAPLSAPAPHPGAAGLAGALWSFAPDAAPWRLVPAGLLAVIALARPQARSAFWAGIAALALLLALTDLGPPGLTLAADFAPVFALALALLAGFGVDHVTALLERSSRIGPLRARAATLALVALLAANFVLAGPDVALGPAFDGADLALPGPVVAALASSRPPFRVAFVGDRARSYGYVQRIEAIEPAGSPTLASVRQLEQSLPAELAWQLLDVRYLVGRPDQVAGAPLVAAGDLAIWSAPRPSARFWVVHAASTDFAVLRQPGFDPFQVALLDRPIELPGGPPTPAEGLRPVERSPQRLLAEVRLETDGLVIASEVDYPGWHTRLDGRPVAVLRAYGALRAVAVPAGSHQLEFYFDPFTFRLGSAISLTTLGLALALVHRARLVPGAVPAPAASVGVPLVAPRVLLVPLVVLALALRVYGLGDQPLRGDEAFVALLVRQDLPAIWAAIAGLGEPHPPLYFTLVHLWTRLAGDSEVALRLPSVLFGVAAVPLTWVLGRRLFGPGPALLAALFSAAAFVAVGHSREARMYAAALAFSAASSALLFEALARGSRRWWLAYAASLAGLLSTHYFGTFLLFGHAAAVPLHGSGVLSRCVLPLDHSLETAAGGSRGPNARDRLAAVRNWLLAGLAALLIVAPWLVLAAGSLVGHEKDWLPPLDAFTVLRRTLLAFLAAPLQPEWPRALPLPGFVGPLWAGVLGVGVLGLALDRRPLPGGAVAAGTLFLVPLGAIYAASLVRPLFLERYLIVLLPPFLTLLAGLTVHLAGGRIWPVAGVAALFLVGNLWAGAGLVAGPGPDDRGPHRAAAFVQERGESGDLVLLNVPDPDVVYYLGRGGTTPRYQVVPSEPGATYEAVAAQLTDLTASAQRVWLLPNRLLYWDRDGLVERWLRSHALLVSETRPGDVPVQQYETAAGLAARAPAPPVDFGGQIRLGPYEATAGEVVRGTKLRVALFWQALRRLDRDYTVFLHLAEPGGRVVSQADGPPGTSAPPTGQWRPGETFADLRELPVPDDVPPGRYEVRVGLYLRDRGERLLAPGGGDHVVLAELTVP